MNAFKLSRLNLGLYIFVFLLFFIGGHVDAQSADIFLEIESASIESGDTVDLPIYINTIGEPISAITTNITYDSTNIDILNCTLTNGIGACNIIADGLIQLAAIDVNGMQTKTQIATVQLRAKEVEWDVVPLNPTTSLIGNATGKSLSDFSDVAGQISINLSPTNISIANSAADKPIPQIQIGIIILIILLISALIYYSQRNRFQ